VTEATIAVSPPVRRLGTLRIGLLTLYWVALGYLWLPLGSQVLPIMILNMVGDAHKGAAVATLEGVGTFVAIFWQPIMGAISDRTRSRFGRRKPFIFAGTLGSSLCLLLMIGAGSYLWLFVFYSMLQLSENAAQAPYQGLLPDVVPEEERSRASGFVGGGNLVGLAIGFAVVGTFMGAHRTDLALISMVIMLLVAMIIVVTLFPDRVKPDAGLRLNLRDIVIGTFQISPRKYADFLWLMASRLTILIAVAGLQRYAVFYFKDVFYPGPGQHLQDLAELAGRDLQVIIVLFAIVCSIPSAEISHRTGRKPLIVLSGILGAIGTAGLIFSPYHVLPDAMLMPVAHLFGVPPGLAQGLYFGILVGVAAGVFLAVDWAFMVDVIPTDEAGRFLGFSNIATAGSGVLAGFIGGFLIDIFNAGAPILNQRGGYPVAFGVYIVFFLIGTLTILKVRETRGRRRAHAVGFPAGH
jgi:MFS family permease